MTSSRRLHVLPSSLTSESVLIITELTLALLPFSDASMVRLRDVEGDAGLPRRLLFIGLPLTRPLMAQRFPPFGPSCGRRRDCDIRGPHRPVRTERGEPDPDPPDRRRGPFGVRRDARPELSGGQWINRERERLTTIRGQLTHSGPEACDPRAGASTRELMHRMGHGSMRAALMYQHATGDRDREIARCLRRSDPAGSGEKWPVRGPEPTDEASPTEGEDEETGSDYTVCCGVRDENRNLHDQLGRR